MFVLQDYVGVGTTVGAVLPATNRLPRRQIREQPSDMGVVNCELSGHLLSDE